jgi:hypothetical protein
VLRSPARSFSARLRGRERLYGATALGYGVIGSPTGSGPVSLGSSPGTPAEAGFPAHWPLANFAGARSAFPGGRPPGPPGAGFPCSLAVGQFRRGPQCFPGGTTPRTPRAAHSRLVGWGPSAGFCPCLAPRVGSSRVGSSRAARSPGGGWGPSARFCPCLAPPRGLLSRGLLPRGPGPQVGGQPCWPGSLRAWALALDALGLCAPRPGPPRPGMLPRSVARPHGPVPAHGGDPHMARRDYGERSQAYVLRTLPVSRIARKRGLWGAKSRPGGGKEHPRPRRGGARTGTCGWRPGWACGWRRGRGPGWRPQDQCPPEVRGGQPAGLSGEALGRGRGRKRLRLTEGEGPARGDDEGGGLTAGRPVYHLVTYAVGNGRARHP